MLSIINESELRTVGIHEADLTVGNTVLTLYNLFDINYCYNIKTFLYIIPKLYFFIVFYSVLFELRVISLLYSVTVT